MKNCGMVVLLVVLAWGTAAAEALLVQPAVVAAVESAPHKDSPVNGSSSTVFRPMSDS